MAMLIDLRSDFVSRPTPEMIRAMNEAATLPCSFGLRESPVQRRLEELAAGILGKEDALFFPTCTMCNQTAINIFCSPGEKFVAEAESHCILSEAGAPSAISGVMAIPVPGKAGFVSGHDIQRVLESGDELRSRTSLLVVENTHNRSGGAVLSVAQMKEIFELASQRGVPVHLDGARVFNAAVRLAVAPSDLAAFADSVAVSLNKGLSAPMGAVLAGTASFISEALTVRQRLGGGWRPTDILAAAGIVALETMIPRLAEDHEHARMLAVGLAGCRHLRVDPSRVQTNLVLARLDHPRLSVEEVMDRLKAEGILVIQFGPRSVRLALHREIGKSEVQYVIEKFNGIMHES
jgi:threonine aldolase